jgi:hypothetical protein
MSISSRIRAADAAFAAVRRFAGASRYSDRRLAPGISDFTFGNPQEMPLPGIVSAIRDKALPHDKSWFAYKTTEEEPQRFLSERLGRELGLPFEPADIALTAGAFAAIMVAIRLVLDAGDEAIYSEPAWFCYEPMLLAADAAPRKVPLKAPTFDLDLAAIDAAIGPRTRLVIVNTPHNPTGRIYGRDALRELSDLLDRASARIGQRIYLLSDEPYRRLRFDGRGFVSPAALYPWTLISCSYGKGAPRSGSASWLSGGFTAHAGFRSSGAPRLHVFRANGAWVVLSECCDAVCIAGSGRPFNRPCRTCAASRRSDRLPQPIRLCGPTSGWHFLPLDQMARGGSGAYVEPARRSRRVRNAGQPHERQPIFPR